MKMKQIRSMAKTCGINTSGKTKADLVREIQRAEGNFDCFGSATDYCDQYQCCFRSLCLPLPQKGRSKQEPSTYSPSNPGYYSTKYLLAGYYSRDDDPWNNAG